VPSDLRIVDVYLVTQTPTISRSVQTETELVAEGALAYLGRARSDIWSGGAGVSFMYDLAVVFKRIPQNDTVWEYVWDLTNAQNIWILVTDTRSAWYNLPFKCIEIRHSDADVRSRMFEAVLYCAAVAANDQVLVDNLRLVGRPP
jgi:hypothetical protein